MDIRLEHNDVAAFHVASVVLLADQRREVREPILGAKLVG